MLGAFLLPFILLNDSAGALLSCNFCPTSDSLNTYLHATVAVKTNYIVTSFQKSHENPGPLNGYTKMLALKQRRLSSPITERDTWRNSYRLVPKKKPTKPPEKTQWKHRIAVEICQNAVRYRCIPTNLITCQSN